MTKRFTYVKNNSITQYQALPIQEIGKGKAFHCQGIVDKLNKLSDENEQLWNKKERYKRLSEIRQQEINNRILTIKEFINNCSDNKVRSVLKELFYSEVNEYDLSSENRKLLNENEKLKQFKENVIKWVDSQMKFNVKKYIETEDYNFKSENIDLHNFKVFIGIDSDE